MTVFEQMVHDRLEYLTKRVDELHGIVSGHKVKFGFLAIMAGMVGSWVFALLK